MARFGGWLILCGAVAGCGNGERTAPATPTAAAHMTAESAVGKDQPVVVVVRADWCPACRRIEPTVAALEREYAGRVTFLVIDLTDEATTERSRAAAESAGLGAFFSESESTGVVAVFGRDRKRSVATLTGETDIARYRAPLSTALASE